MTIKLDVELLDDCDISGHPFDWQASIEQQPLNPEYCEVVEHSYQIFPVEHSLARSTRSSRMGMMPSLCGNRGETDVKDEMKLTLEGFTHTSMMGVGVAILWRYLCTGG
jgi:hypothetical protein